MRFARRCRGCAKRIICSLFGRWQHCCLCLTAFFLRSKATAQKLIEIANTVKPVQDGRIFIELINGPFLYDHKGSPAEYGAGLRLAIERGWLWKHESGTYVKLTQSGADLFV